MNVKWWIARIIGVALIVLGAALWASAQEPTGSAGVIPAVPTGAAPRALPAVTPAAPLVPVAVPTSAPPAAATGPAATTPTPSITVTIPHDDHMHFTRVMHWHFPSRTPRAATPPAAPRDHVCPVCPMPLPSPQAPPKYRFFR